MLFLPIDHTHSTDWSGLLHPISLASPCEEWMVMKPSQIFPTRLITEKEMSEIMKGGPIEHVKPINVSHTFWDMPPPFAQSCHNHLPISFLGARRRSLNTSEWMNDWEQSSIHRRPLCVYVLLLLVLLFSFQGFFSHLPHFLVMTGWVGGEGEEKNNLTFSPHPPTHCFDPSPPCDWEKRSHASHEY